MKSHMRIFIVMIIGLFIGLAACSNDTEETQGEQTENTEGQTVVTAFSSIPPNIADMNDNLLTQKIEDLLDVDIEFQTTPTEGADQRQSLLLNSGDYPVSFIGGNFTLIEQMRYGEEGTFIPLNDLIEEHAPNIKETFEEEPWLEEAITMPDGNIYALPGRTGCYHCNYPMKMWINTTWLDELGLEMPETLAEFEQVLKAFQSEDANGNGVDDEIPLGGITGDQYMNPINFLMHSFIYTDPANYLQVSDGNVEFVPSQPEWREGLEFVESLYAKGLIDPQAFTQNVEGIRQQANQEDLLIGAFPSLWSGEALTIEDDAENWKHYEATPPLDGPSGLKQALFTGENAGAGRFAITDKATEEQQIAAIKIADYIYSEEGSLDVMYGVDGWEYADGEDLGVNGKPAIFERVGDLDWSQPSNSLWDNNFANISDDLYNGQVAGQDPFTLAGYEKFLYLQTVEKYEGLEPEEVLANVKVDPENAQKVAELGTDIISHLEQSAVQFVIGERDLDAEWETYLSELEDLGVEEYVQIYQEAHDAE